MINELFAKAAENFGGGRDTYLKKVNGKVNGRTKNVAKIFNRKVLGICKTYSIKSLDELANALYEIGAVESIEDGKEFASQLYGLRLDYGEGILNFIEVEKDNKGACLITRDSYAYRKS